MGELWVGRIFRVMVWCLSINTVKGNRNLSIVVCMCNLSKVFRAKFGWGQFESCMGESKCYCEWLNRLVRKQIPIAYPFCIEIYMHAYIHTYIMIHTWDVSVAECLGCLSGQMVSVADW